MYSVEDMVNTLDDCDILEKAILMLGDLIIVHIQYFMIILNHSALMNYLAYVFDALVYSTARGLLLELYCHWQYFIDNGYMVELPIAATTACFKKPDLTLQERLVLVKLKNCNCKKEKCLGNKKIIVVNYFPALCGYVDEC